MEDSGLKFKAATITMLIVLGIVLFALGCIFVPIIMFSLMVIFFIVILIAGTYHTVLYELRGRG